jgi:hypothetical protein
MATPGLHEDEVKRRKEAIEQCLREGYSPVGVRMGTKGSAVEEAARRLGNVKASSLATALRGKSLEPDWTQYVPAPDARRGYSPEHDMTRTVPDGYFVKGVSSYYDADGNLKGQWVKSSADQERQDEIFREAIAAMVDEIEPAAPVKPPKSSLDHLMACYPVGDHHLGMLSWAEETGANYDLDIAERLLSGAATHLVQTAPHSTRAVIVILGDFLHYDSFVAVTPTNKNPLDADGRYPKMVRVAIRSLRRMVKTALEHHQEVLLIIEFGNHDPATSVFLMEALAALYDDEPRVTVDRSPRHHHYFSFGKCLVGTHHGHGTKMADLPLLMATDQPDLWGQAEYRYWWTGHVHHDQAKDFNGCRVESFRILAPADAWAANKGYRSQRDMKAIILHKDYGEVARHIVNPAMLEAV